jgi:exopolysaccharide production protein ExoQ
MWAEDGRVTNHGQTIASSVLAGVLILAYMWNAPEIIFGSFAVRNGAGDGSSDLARQMCFILLLGVMLALIVRSKDLTRLLSVPWIFIPILAWCWLSVLWAVDPAAAVRRICFTTIVILIVSYAVEVLPIRRTLDVLLVVLCCILVIDWLAIAVLPLAIHQGDELDGSLAGDWRGIHEDKNEAGAFCALCLIICVHEAVRLRSYLSGLFISSLAAIFLYKTHSKTSGGFVGIALCIGLLSQYGFGHPRVRRIAFLCMTASVLLAVPFLGDISALATNAIDDPTSLTGRVQIWPVLLDFASDHLLLGAGYGSFWGLADNSPILHYGTGWVTTIYEAHNGYLDLLVQVGATGLIIAVLGLIVCPFRILFVRSLSVDVPRSLICSVLAFMCLHDLLESSILDRSNSTWVVMLIMYCVLLRGDGADERSEFSQARVRRKESAGDRLAIQR